MCVKEGVDMDEGQNAKQSTQNRIEDRRVPSRRFWNMLHVSELHISIKISKKFLEAALETSNYGWSKDTQWRSNQDWPSLAGSDKSVWDL